MIIMLCKIPLHISIYRWLFVNLLLSTLLLPITLPWIKKYINFHMEMHFFRSKISLKIIELGIKLEKIHILTYNDGDVCKYKKTAPVHTEKRIHVKVYTVNIINSYTVYDDFNRKMEFYFLFTLKYFILNTSTVRNS